MAKKKKQLKKKPRQHSTLTQEQESLLDSLLQNLGAIDGANVKDHIPDPRIAQALIERLPVETPEIVDLIMAVREAFAHKDVQKAIKKASYRLKQKGIVLPETDTPSTPRAVLGKGEQLEPEAYLGLIDGSGNRPVLILLPHLTQGVDLGMGILSDELGIKEFLYGRYSRKRMKEVRDLFFERFNPMVGTSLAHAATALENAYARNQARTGESVEDYLRLRPYILENVELLSRSPAHDEIDPEGREEALTRSSVQRLLGHRFLQSWVIDAERIVPLIEEISEAEQSPILVSEGQKLNRINEIKEKAVLRFFPAPKRSILKDRLEEMAYVFLKEEDESHARICLAAAASLDVTSTLLGTNPFLMALVDRTLGVLKEGMEIGDKAVPHHDDSTSIIIP